MELYYDTMTSPLGLLYIICDAKNLKAIEFAKAIKDLKKRYRLPLVQKSTPLTKKVSQQLEQYFAKKRNSFDVPLAPEGTAFQKKAWEALLGIPYGKTVSYQEQAIKTGKKSAVRAIGGANGKNPIPIIIPCHRVIGKNGTLVGYAGGLSIKEKLLALEGYNF
jgi:methylated-DNA-[protein]-cysteine S-methyltransferase